MNWLISHVNFHINAPPPLSEGEWDMNTECSPFIMLCLGSIRMDWVIKDLGYNRTISGVKDFRIIPKIRILKLTFHRKSATKC